MRLLRIPIQLFLVASMNAQEKADWGSRISAVLKAAKEPQSLSLADGAQQFRVVWMRTFHHPVIIRVWKARGHQRVRVVVLGGKAGFGIGSIIEDRQFKISEEAWSEMLEETKRLKFSSEFRDPSDPPPVFQIKVASDGSELSFESKGVDQTMSFRVSQPDSKNSASEARSLQALQMFLTLATARDSSFY